MMVRRFCAQILTPQLQNIYGLCSRDQGCDPRLILTDFYFGLGLYIDMPDSFSVEICPGQAGVQT